MAEIRRIVGENGDWVEFKPSGYPFKLRKQLQGNDDETVLGIILPYVTAFNLTQTDGTKVETLDNLSDVDEQTVVNIIWKFYEFRGDRQREPLSKNN